MEHCVSIMSVEVSSSEGMTRRTFVGIAAVGGIAVGFLAGWLSKPAEKVVEEVIKEVTVTETEYITVPEPIYPQRRVVEPQQGWHKVVDYGRCVGCRLCEYECALKYQPEDFQGVNLEYSRIRMHRFLYVDAPIFCRYCHLEDWVEGTTKSPCEYSCPFDALPVVEEVMEEGKIGNGYKWIDPEKCVGLEECGRCLEICEEQFGSGIVFLPKDDKGIKRGAVCTMCAGEPACVNACPEQALRFEPPQQDGRYYAHRPSDLGELLFLKLYGVRRNL